MAEVCARIRACIDRTAPPGSVYRKMADDVPPTSGKAYNREDVQLRAILSALRQDIVSEGAAPSAPPRVQKDIANPNPFVPPNLSRKPSGVRDERESAGSLGERPHFDELIARQMKAALYPASKEAAATGDEGSPPGSPVAQASFPARGFAPAERRHGLHDQPTQVRPEPITRVIAPVGIPSEEGFFGGTVSLGGPPPRPDSAPDRASAPSPTSPANDASASDVRRSFSREIVESGGSVARNRAVENASAEEAVASGSPRSTAVSEPERAGSLEPLRQTAAVVVEPPAPVDSPTGPLGPARQDEPPMGPPLDYVGAPTPRRASRLPNDQDPFVPPPLQPPHPAQAANLGELTSTPSTPPAARVIAGANPSEQMAPSPAVTGGFSGRSDAVSSASGTLADGDVIAGTSASRDIASAPAQWPNTVDLGVAMGGTARVGFGLTVTPSGIGAEGSVRLTEPDSISRANLNRIFGTGERSASEPSASTPDSPVPPVPQPILPDEAHPSSRPAGLHDPPSQVRPEPITQVIAPAGILSEERSFDVTASLGGPPEADVVGTGPGPASHPNPTVTTPSGAGAEPPRPPVALAVSEASGPSVELRHGDLLSDPESQVVVLPCSTAGTTKRSWTDLIRELKLVPPGGTLEFGALSDIQVHGSRAFVYAASVHGDASDAEAIQKLGVALGKLTAHSRYRTIAAPLLGAGKNRDGQFRTPPEASYDALAEGFRSAAVPGARLTLWERDEAIFMLLTGQASPVGTAPLPAPSASETLGDLSTPSATPKRTQGDSVQQSSISDAAVDVDSIGFKPYVDAMARFIVSPQTEPPLTISIEGRWGSGKSSFMQQLEKEVRSISGRRVLTVRFNAWRHDKSDALWAAFATAFLEQVRAQRCCLLNWLNAISLVLRRTSWRRAGFDVMRKFLLLLGGGLLFLGGAALVVNVAQCGATADTLTALVAAHTAANRPDAGALDVTNDPRSLRAESDAVGKDRDASEDKKNQGPLLTWLELIARVALPTGGIVGTWGLLLTLFLRLSKRGLLPNIDWKGYSEAPDYDGRREFLSLFHEDFAHVVKSFAGSRRICVFVDDLDRCEVPKAAELMQALNLMLSDDKQILFVLGMDREKVAAGIAAKNKELLPYVAPGLPDGADIRGLEFGYEFIEKFIQIPFALPSPRKEDFETFLSGLVKNARSRLSAADAARWDAERDSAKAAEVHSAEAPNGVGNAGEQVRAQTAGSGAPVVVFEETPAAIAARTAQWRKFEPNVSIDSPRVQRIILLAAAALDYNPRRVKQFINIFRLRAYMAYRTGLFEKDRALTLEQLGKFVAIGLRWPLLMNDLARSPKLLGQLEVIAREANSPSVLAQKADDDDPLMTKLRTRPTLLSLLADGVGVGDESMADVDVAALLRVQPARTLADTPTETPGTEVAKPVTPAGAASGPSNPLS